MSVILDTRISALQWFLLKAFSKDREAIDLAILFLLGLTTATEMDHCVSWS